MPIWCDHCNSHTLQHQTRHDDEYGRFLGHSLKNVTTEHGGGGGGWQLEQ